MIYASQWVRAGFLALALLLDGVLGSTAAHAGIVLSGGTGDPLLDAFLVIGEGSDGLMTLTDEPLVVSPGGARFGSPGIQGQVQVINSTWRIGGGEGCCLFLEGVQPDALTNSFLDLSAGGLVEVLAATSGADQGAAILDINQEAAAVIVATTGGILRIEDSSLSGPADGMNISLAPNLDPSLVAHFVNIFATDPGTGIEIRGNDAFVDLGRPGQGVIDVTNGAEFVISGTGEALSLRAGGVEGGIGRILVRSGGRLAITPDPGSATAARAEIGVAPDGDLLGLASFTFGVMRVQEGSLVEIFGANGGDPSLRVGGGSFGALEISGGSDLLLGDPGSGNPFVGFGLDKGGATVTIEGEGSEFIASGAAPRLLVAGRERLSVEDGPLGNFVDMVVGDGALVRLEDLQGSDAVSIFAPIPGSFARLGVTEAIFHAGDLALFGRDLDPMTRLPLPADEPAGSVRLSVLGSGRVEASQILIGAGFVSGDGTLAGAVELDGSHVTPGQILGPLTVEGSLAIGSASLSILTNGVGETRQSFIEVAGPAEVQGSLSAVIDFANGFIPQPGDRFILLRAQDLQVTGTVSASGEGGVFEVVQEGNTLFAELAEPFLQQPRAIASAVLPTSRSGSDGSFPSFFVAIVNVTDQTLTDCFVSFGEDYPIGQSIVATDPETNLPLPGSEFDILQDLPPHGFVTYAITLFPLTALPPTEVQFLTQCGGLDIPGLPFIATPQIQTGINTAIVAFSHIPTPDVVALAATVLGDGIVRLSSFDGSGAFAVATSNVGSEGEITVTLDTGLVELPVTLLVCETEPSDGSACLQPPSESVTTTIPAGGEPTFAIFVTAMQEVPFNPGGNRVFVRFRDAEGVIRGSTNVAVLTGG